MVSAPKDKWGAGRPSASADGAANCVGSGCRGEQQVALHHHPRPHTRAAACPPQCWVPCWCGCRRRPRPCAQQHCARMRLAREVAPLHEATERTYFKRRNALGYGRCAGGRREQTWKEGNCGLWGGSWWFRWDGRSQIQSAEATAVATREALDPLEPPPTRAADIARRFRSDTVQVPHEAVRGTSDAGRPTSRIECGRAPRMRGRPTIPVK